MSFFNKKSNKKSEPEPESTPEVEEAEKVPFNPAPLIWVGGIIVIIAFAAASINWGVESVVRNIFIFILFVLFVAKTWGKWKNFNVQRAGVAILITAILALMYAFKVGIDATVAFMGSDQSILSPTLAYAAVLLIAFGGYGYFKKEESNNFLVPFWWFAIPNLLYAGFANYLTKNIYFLIAVPFYMFVVLGISRVLEKALANKNLSPSGKQERDLWLGLAVGIAIVSIMGVGNFVMWLTSNLDLDSDFYWWKIYSSIGGIIIGVWASYVYMKRSRYLPDIEI